MRAEDLTPNKPRPMSAVIVGNVPGTDARWRNVPRRVKVIDQLAVRDLQRQARERSVNRAQERRGLSR